jgi:hypothetical protein
MAVEFWQIAQARRALNAFCDQHRLYVDEEAARKASDYLLGATDKGIDDLDKIYSELRSHAFASSAESTQDE